MFIRDLLMLVAPENFDPVLLWITVVYLWGLLTVFVLAVVFIPLPITIRWVRLFRALRCFEKEQQVSDEPKSIRQSIATKLFHKVRWAEGFFKEYRMAWEDARVAEDDKSLLPLRLTEFLTPEIVIERIRKRRIAEAMPGIFVALGIFGTFLGLVLGLKGLQLDAIEKLQQGVGHLISGLSLSFITSLAGIFFSILFSFGYRSLTTGLESALFKLDQLLLQAYPCHSSEYYIRKYYELQADVKQGLQTLATDVAAKISDNIGSKMGEALDNSLVPVMTDLRDWLKKGISETKHQQDMMLTVFGEQLSKMSETITDHFENSQQKQSEAMDAVLKQYVENMNESFMSQFQDMGRIIEETTKVQSDIRGQLLEFTNQLQNQFQSQSELIDKTNRAGEILGQSLGSLELISQKLKTSAEDISSAAQLLESSATSAKEGQEALQESMESQIQTMAQVKADLEGSWGAITENAYTVVELIRLTIQELEKGIGENMTQAFQTYDQKVAEVVERLSGTLFEINQTMEEMPALISGLDENMRTMGSAITEQKEVLSELKDTTAGIVSTNIEKAVQASDQLSRTTEHMAAAAMKLQSFFDEMFVKLEDGPISTTLKELTVKMENLALPDGGNIQNESELLGSLADRLRELKEVLDRKQNNGDASGSEAVLKRLAAIHQHIHKFSSGMEAEILPNLSSLNESVKQISGSFEEMKSLAIPMNKSGDMKRGLFSRMMKK